MKTPKCSIWQENTYIFVNVLLFLLWCIMLAYCLSHFFVVFFSPINLLSSCLLVSKSEVGF